MLLFVLVIAGCATPPREVPDDRAQAWEVLRERLETVEQWRADGRFAFRSGADGGSAGFVWHEYTDDRFTLRLSGPWGQGTARLSGGNGLARLETADAMVYHGPDAESLLYSVYGWEIPVDGLRRWLIGLPSADEAPDDHVLDHFGRLESLYWEGWEIRYRRYRPVNDLDLPAELVASHAARGVEVRMAVDRWYPGDSDDEPRDAPAIPLMDDD